MRFRSWPASSREATWRLVTLAASREPMAAVTSNSSRAEKSWYRAEVEAAERAFAVAFPDVTREILDLFSEGDRVVARTAIWGTHRGEFNGIAPTDRAVQTSGPALVQASYLRSGVLQRLRRVAPAGPTSSAAGP